MGYAELHCLSNFSFLRGASHPEELVERAAELGYAALAVTDECSVAGVVRAHLAARERGSGSSSAASSGSLTGCARAARDRPVAMASVPARHARHAVRRPRDATAWRARDVAGEPCRAASALWLPAAPEGDPAEAAGSPALSRPALDRRGTAHHRAGSPPARGAERLGGELGLPLVAAGDVHMHVRGRRALQDVLTAIRLRCRWSRRARRCTRTASVTCVRSRGCGTLSARAARRHARGRRALRLLAGRAPLRVPATNSSRRARRPASGCAASRRRASGGAGPRARRTTSRALLEHELALIAELGYEAYFLTVHDIVRSPAAAASSARDAARRPTPPSATASASPRWTRRA